MIEIFSAATLLNFTKADGLINSILILFIFVGVFVKRM